MTNQFWDDEWKRLLKTRAQSEDIRVLTLHQPDASLMAANLKHFEIRRSKPVQEFKGKVLIHAAAAKCNSGRLKWFIEMAERFPEVREAFESKRLPSGIYKASTLQHGCILAIADLVDYKRIDNDFIKEQSGLELAVGYWQIGRFAWQFDHIIPSPNPIYYKNNQGLQKLDVDQLTCF